uniref:Uncharacterized protein n=1 Tax=Micrurus lemniscatus lemniscatus TaxID=129467 RepID=A0A2D4JLZ8_MICLE
MRTGSFIGMLTFTTFPESFQQSKWGKQNSLNDPLIHLTLMATEPKKKKIIKLGASHLVTTLVSDGISDPHVHRGLPTEDYTEDYELLLWSWGKKCFNNSSVRAMLHEGQPQEVKVSSLLACCQHRQL